MNWYVAQEDGPMVPVGFFGMLRESWAGKEVRKREWLGSRYVLCALSSMILKHRSNKMERALGKPKENCTVEEREEFRIIMKF